MAFPRPGPCSERAWSLLRPMGAQRGGEPPHLPSLLASQPRRWPVQEVLGWGVGLLYLCPSDKFKMSPLFLQEPSGQQELHCMWVSKVPTRFKHPLTSSSTGNLTS